MKRFLSCFLAFVMVITAFPFTAMADDTNDAVRDEIISQACSAFPEYASRIVAQENARSTYAMPRSADTPTIIVNETRSVDENSYVNYVEYSNGAILLSNYDTTYTTTTIDRETSAYAAHVTVDIKATRTGISGYFKIDDLKYSLINGGYDFISDEGTASRSGNCNDYSEPYTILEETASSYARVAYTLTFKYSSQPGDLITSNLVITVGNNSFNVSHTAYE